jgi:hypothetical protein
MELTRRGMLRRLLGTAGVVSLATGVPASFLRIAGCKRAGAGGARPDFAARDKARFLVLSMSRHGPPINANTPGSYELPGIIHAPVPEMQATTFSLGNVTVRGAQTWSTLPEHLRARTCFFHGSTGTVVHTDTAKVATLMGAAAHDELMVSAFAAELSSPLETVTTMPISFLTNEHPDERAIFEGRNVPNLSALKVRDMILAEGGMLRGLRRLRDLSMDRLHGAMKANGTPEERAYVDSVAQSALEARDLGEQLLGSLSACVNPDGNTQALVAAALIRMKVTPVVVVNFPFGGDNHIDRNLEVECRQLPEAIRCIETLFAQLAALGMADQTTFATLNPFGRTLKENGIAGRNHVDHHVSVIIGKGIRGGVVGGVTPVPGGDYGALEIDSKSGRGVEGGGDVPRVDQLASLAKTVGAGLGIAPAKLDEIITKGKVVPAALDA